MLLMTMTKKYWIQRFEEEEVRNSKVSLREMQIAKKQYQNIMNNLDKEIRSWYSKYAKENSLTYEEAQKTLSKKNIRELKMSLKEYIKLGEQQNVVFNRQIERLLKKVSVGVHVSRLESIKSSIQAELDVLYTNVERGLGKHFSEVIGKGYARTSYLVQSMKGSYEIISGLNQEAIDRVIYKPWTSDGVNWSKRIWKQKDKLVEEVHSALTRSLVLGDDINVLAEEMSKRLNVGFNRAANLLMTESAAYHSKATEMCYKDLGVEKYEILATLDSRTSSICQSMDGKIFERKQYQVGITAPPFHCRCRTTTIPYFEDMIEDEIRVGRDEEENHVEEKASMKYPEWKEKYLNKEDIGKFENNIFTILEKEFGKLNTSEVILRKERLHHIKERHPEVTDLLKNYGESIISNPDYVLKDSNKEDTVWNIKKIEEKNINMVIKLSVLSKKEHKGYSNSVITSVAISDKRLNNYLKSRKLIYKKK